MGTALPTPRDFVSTLLDTLASAAAPPRSSASGGGGGGGGGGEAGGDGDRREGTGGGSDGENPLKRLGQTSPQHRALLTTLHALYPSILLPALDVLDRGLASRVFVAAAAAPRALASQTNTDETAGFEGADDAEGRGGGDPTFHIVRSSQKQKQKQQGKQAPTTTYVVRLRAWSCTCAAFAFAAYPFEGASSTNTIITTTTTTTSASSTSEPYTISPWSSTSLAERAAAAGGTQHRDAGVGREPRHDFGGLSMDGSGSGSGSGSGGGGAAGVPACKHLLACALAERLGLLGAYVGERRAGREEGAGLVADL